MFGTWLTISETNARPDNRAETESRINTSAPEARMEQEVLSGTPGETPHTLKSPLLLNSLARASRNSRFPATRKTEGLRPAILPPDEDTY